MTVEEKFMRTYDECADGIFRFCYYRLFDRELAKDLTQEAFMKTWRYMASGKEVENVRAFVYKTARNLIIDHSRKKKPIPLDNIQMEEWAASIDGPDGANIDASLVLKKLNNLPDKFREVVIMRYVEELTPTEIAEILNETPNAVSIRINRAINKLKDLCHGQN